MAEGVHGVPAADRTPASNAPAFGGIGPGGSGSECIDPGGSRRDRCDGAADREDPGDTGRAGGSRLSPLDLPGPTGESNRLSFAPRGVVLRLGPGTAAARAQLTTALDAGNAIVVVVDGAAAALTSLAADPRIALLDGQVDPESLVTVDGIAAVACSAERDVLRSMREALTRRPGPILPLIAEPAAVERYVLERHVCVDTTAAGGNASLLARAEA